MSQFRRAARNFSNVPTGKEGNKIGKLGNKASFLRELLKQAVVREVLAVLIRSAVAFFPVLTVSVFFCGVSAMEDLQGKGNNGGVGWTSLDRTNLKFIKSSATGSG